MILKVYNIYNRAISLLEKKLINIHRKLNIPYNKVDVRVEAQFLIQSSSHELCVHMLTYGEVIRRRASEYEDDLLVREIEESIDTYRVVPSTSEYEDDLPF